MATETRWVAIESHRARARMKAVTGDLQSYGVWPVDKAGETTGWPRGEYYQVPARLIDDQLTRIKGLRVMKREPRGKVFKRIGG